MKHSWTLAGGSGDWEVWDCKNCGRSAIPSIFGFLWPWPSCERVQAKRAHQRRDRLAREIFIADNHEATNPNIEWDKASAGNRAHAYVVADKLIAAGYEAAK